MIEQRGGHDCGIAALANALGVTYEEAQRELGLRDPNREEGVEFNGGRNVGIIPEELALVAFKRGIPCHIVDLMQRAPEDSYRYVWRDVFFCMTVEDVSHAVFVEGLTGILGVDSKNHSGGGHWITVKNKVILDPARSRKYRQGEELPLQVAVLFKGE